MKLKKIASLALAGIMAVSMLAGCGDKGTTNEGGNTVTPVDSSLATYINSELTDKEKAVVTFSSDATVEAALKKVAATIPSADLASNSAYANGTWYAGSVVSAFREAIDAEKTWDIEQVYNTTNASNNTDWMVKDRSVASMMIIPAFNGDEAMKEAVLNKVQSLIVGMPSKARQSGVDYRVDYTGKVAVTKVTSADDKNVAYVVGIVVDLTATKLA